MTARCQEETLAKKKSGDVAPSDTGWRRSGVAGVTGDAGKGISCRSAGDVSRSVDRLIGVDGEASTESNKAMEFLLSGVASISTGVTTEPRRFLSVRRRMLQGRSKGNTPASLRAAHSAVAHTSFSC